MEIAERYSVLFVDDEPNVLHGLERMLFDFNDTFDFEFANSGAEALALMEGIDFDIVVSDMRMPEMNGAQLLTRVASEYPRVLRVVLTGHTELEAAMQAISVAHQFLSKPSPPDELVNVLLRSLELRHLVEDSQLRSMVGKIQSLPARPGRYSEIVTVMSSPSGSLRDVAEIVRHDVGIASKILQVANSAFFNRGIPIESIENAVPRLGLQAVKSVVLSFESYGAFGVRETRLLDEISERALDVASISRALTSDKIASNVAFTAGLMHDIGRVVLLSQEDADYASLCANTPYYEICSAELERYGVAHPEIGAYLLKLWGIPFPVVEGVAYHHRPNELRPHGSSVALSIGVSEAIVDCAGDVAGVLESRPELREHEDLVRAAAGFYVQSLDGSV